MKDDLSASSSDPFVLLPRATTNSRVVREVDPRASRDLWLLLMLVAGLVGGMALYAWPRVQAHSLDSRSQQNQKTHEQLVEQNRKLRLEKARLERLERVAAIAAKMGLSAPDTARLYVVEPASPPASDAQFARAPDAGNGTRVN
jgi:cell division protein FtsL